MKGKIDKVKFHDFFSLGSTCQAAYQLKRLGLRQQAGPLDWFTSRSVPQVARLIRSRFEAFMDLNHLQVTGAVGNYFVVKDSLYQIESYHDFPVAAGIQRWWQPYSDFRDKINRRVQRFLFTAQRYPVCLVRVDATLLEAQQLMAALQTLAHPNSSLLVINLCDNNQERIKVNNWRLNRVLSVTIPRGIDWRGSDSGWNQLMRRYKLLGKLPLLRASH